MCGIAGQISADPNKIAADYPAYCRMQKSLARRGPDQRGMYLHGHAALIHARLAVVDLENGCQPMVLDQGGEKYILVYNGELYNTPELHAQLAALGHRFVSHSDTEVLLHAFAQWGPDCLEKLNGIFAFAVWQQRAQKLFLGAGPHRGQAAVLCPARGQPDLCFRAENAALPPGDPAAGGCPWAGRCAAARPRPHAGVRGVPQCAGIEAPAAAQNTLCHRLVRRASPCAATGS